MCVSRVAGPGYSTGVPRDGAKRVVQVAVFAALCASAGGCRLLPPNYLRLVTAERAGWYPPLLGFTRGIAVESDDGAGMVVMAGPRAVLLFDHAGPTNRVQLAFVQDEHLVLYERIGQRIEPPVADRDLGRAGVRCRKEDGHLRGSIDVFVAVTERDGLETPVLFEHYPRVMRLVGYFAVPLRGTAAEAALDPSAVPTADATAPITWLGAMGDRKKTRLPRLPIVDVKYLVPTTLVGRLVEMP